MFGGVPLFGGLGLNIFGPINGNTDIWALIGGLIGAAFYVHFHFVRKREKQQKRSR